VAEQLAKVGDVIQPGESIPEDVTAFTDKDGDGPFDRISAGWWNCDRDNPAGCVRHTDAELLEYAPLTVTAVREPEQAYAGGMECPVCGSAKPHNSHEPVDVVHYRIPGDASARTLCGEDIWEESTSVTERAGSSNCGACRAAADEEPTPCPSHGAHPHWNDATCLDCPICRPPADASVLLDLVRQHGDAQRKVGYEEGRNFDYGISLGKAAEVFDRIAALVPQHPVQARDEAGLPLFIHACGHVSPDSTPGVAEGEHHRFPPCRTPGPWRPLLVGGDPAPKIGIDRHEPHADGPREPTWQEVGDHFLMEALGVQKLDEVMPAIERLKAAAPQQDGPIVLTLPAGVVALVGVKSGLRYVQRGPFIWEPDEADSELYGLQQVLAREGKVAVEMAPPREPRIWKQLRAAPADIAKKLEVRQSDGTQFVVALRGDGRWASTIAFPNPENAEPHETFAWSELLGEGDVTEVLDEPGGQQR
jgi:hypothetical protein